MSFLDDAAEGIQDISVGHRLFGGEAAQETAEVGERSARRSLEETQRRFDIGQDRLAPFTEQAIPAFQRQSALAGAQGREAQGLAFQEFEESPATQFLREGGLALSGQGVEGERRAELERFNQGLALQDFGNQFNRLGAVAGSGQAAATDLAGLGEETAKQSIAAQQQAFQAQQQGQAGQQAARNAAAETGAGLASFFSGRNQGSSAGGGFGGGSTLGAPVNQQDFRGFA